MAVKEIYLLPCGYLDLDQGIMTAGIGVGRIVRVPSYAVLIAASEGWVLVDTGLNPDGLDDPGSAWGPRARVVRPAITREDDIRNRLRQAGVAPEEVKLVINTHLHWDHTGGNRFFPGRPIIVQKQEYGFACEQDGDTASPYMANHFRHPLDYELVEGDLEVAGGVSVVSTPGHTPGHQSVVVEVPDGGTVIVAGDAVYCDLNVEGPVPPGHCWSRTHALESIRKLIDLEKRTGGMLLPGHEPAFWSRYEAARALILPMKDQAGASPESPPR